MIVHDMSQGSDDWFQYRAGRPTASNFKMLVTSTGLASKSMKGYAMQLAADKYAGKALDGFSGNQYTDRGTELEPFARKYYEFEKDCDVVETGFITDDLNQYGASPDGLVDDNGLVEFKCQIAKKHIETLLYFDKHDKCPPDYVPQVQGQMHIIEREWCDLVFFHPDLPTLVIRQFPDAKVIDTLKSQLMAVIAERNLILKTIEKY